MWRQCFPRSIDWLCDPSLSALYESFIKAITFSIGLFFPLHPSALSTNSEFQFLGLVDQIPFILINTTILIDPVQHRFMPQKTVLVFKYPLYPLAPF